MQKIAMKSRYSRQVPIFVQISASSGTSHSKLHKWKNIYVEDPRQGRKRKNWAKFRTNLFDLIYLKVCYLDRESMTFKEFWLICQELAEDETTIGDHLLNAFKVLDRDGHGFLPFAQVQAIFHQVVSIDWSLNVCFLKKKQKAEFCIHFR